MINIGSGIEHTIEEYAKIIMKNLNCKFKIIFDRKKPNGMNRKIMNLSLATKYGWASKINFDKAIQKTYLNFLKLQKKI